MNQSDWAIILGVSGVGLSIFLALSLYLVY